MNQPRKTRWKGPTIMMVAGALVGVIGVVAYVWILFAGITSMQPDDRVAVPGRLVIDTQPGDQISVYAESKSVINGTGVAGPDPIPGLVLVATDEQGNDMGVSMSTELASSYAGLEYAGTRVARISSSPGGPVTIDASLTPGTSVNGTPVIAARTGDVFEGFLGMMGFALLGMLSAIFGGMLFLAGLIWLVVALALGASRG